MQAHTHCNDINNTWSTIKFLAIYCFFTFPLLYYLMLELTYPVPEVGEWDSYTVTLWVC